MCSLKCMLNYSLTILRYKMAIERQFCSLSEARNLLRSTCGKHACAKVHTANASMQSLRANSCDRVGVLVFPRLSYRNIVFDETYGNFYRTVLDVPAARSHEADKRVALRASLPGYRTEPYITQCDVHHFPRKIELISHYSTDGIKLSSFQESGSILIAK